MRKTPEAVAVDNNFPRMMYRFPATATDHGAGVTTVALQDGSYDTAIADDAEQHKAGLAEGWCETAVEARAVSDKAVAAEKAAADKAAAKKAAAEAEAAEKAAAEKAAAEKAAAAKAKG